MGGIGPEATGIFYSRLIKILQERSLIRSNKDYPQIIINSIPAKELIHDLSSDDLKDYIAGLKELDDFKVDFIVMVCNTIHLFYEALQKQIKTPILDLRKAMKDFFHMKNARKITILGTQGTIKNGLYEFNGISYINPSEDEIKLLARAIFNFNKGLEKEKQVSYARNICEKYLEKGSDFIVLGCTEFSAMLQNEDFPKIDTIDVLVQATADNFEKFSNLNT